MRQTKWIPERDEPIGAVFRCLSTAIRRGLDNAIAAEVSPELTGARGMVLSYIVNCNAEGRPVYQRDIESRFRIRRSSVTVLLQAMEQAGFISRCPSEKDARLKYLTATEKGLASHSALHECISRYEVAVRRGLPPEDVDTVYRVASRIMENLQQMEETERKEGS